MGGNESFVPVDAAVDGPAAVPSAVLSVWRRLALAGLGFVTVGAAAAAVTLATGEAAPPVGAIPTASPLPTGFDVGLEGSTTADSTDTRTVTLVNRGAAFHIVSARVDGAGYEVQDATVLGGVNGLGVDDQGQLPVVLRPTCGAGVGVNRRPELVLVVRGHDGATRTLRKDLSGSVPEFLLGRCDAPLGTGARLSVTPLPPDADGQLRLRISLIAGRGLLWSDGIESAGGLTFQGFDGLLPLVVAPGSSELLELQIAIGSCADLAGTGDPVALRVRLRVEPDQPTRSLRLAAVGGAPYRRAVAAAVARACR